MTLKFNIIELIYKMKSNLKNMNYLSYKIFNSNK